MPIESVMPSNHLILYNLLFLPPSIFPSIRVFSNESVLCIRWPKCWGFSINISPSNSGLISFRMNWLNLLAVQETLKSLLQHHSSKASILWHSAFFKVQLSNPYMTTGETTALTRWTIVGKVMSVLFNMLSYWSVFIPIPKKGNAKERSNYCTIALISHASKVMLKILQARLQQYMNHELPDVQADFRKGKGTRDQIANICWVTEEAREFKKTSISALLTMPKPLTVWITVNCGKFWKKWEYQTWPASWEICVQGRKQQLELDMEQ